MDILVVKRLEKLQKRTFWTDSIAIVKIRVSRNKETELKGGVYGFGSEYRKILEFKQKKL